MLLAPRSSLTVAHALRCLLEIHTAVTHGVPIVSVLVSNQYRYSFGAAQRFLDGFEGQLEEQNPGASNVLLAHGVTLGVMGQMLREHIPNIIAKILEPSASANVLSAQITDIIDAMEYARLRAHPPPSPPPEQQHHREQEREQVNAGVLSASRRLRLLSAEQQQGSE